METRLLFIGLWTLADRDGRLVDKPKQIKLDLFPADSVDVDACLDALARTAMVTRYEIYGLRCLQVVNFAKHQNPHRAEKPSTIPAPEGQHANPASEPAEHGACTVQAPCKPDATSVAIGLIPDTGFLTPDTGYLIPDTAIKTAPATPLPAASPPPVELAAKPKAKPTMTTIAKPDDVTDQTWADWLQLRAKKRAPVTLTVLAEATSEAEKAKLPMERFLAVWCARGSQGLHAGWLRPEERGPGRSNTTGVASTKATSKHAGFEQLDYREGVNNDGSFN
ncbi:hypothetical protein [Rhodoferax sp.]|uniref:hypothetical protein n=1 Tax=Rhodoferax sp. TaxID=50421 RepID=UPI00374D79A8